DSSLGTAGSVMLARQFLTEPFVVISGDALTDIDLAAAARFHRERKSLATIVLKPVPNPLEYGVVVVDEGGAVQRFIEKPSWGEVISDLANTGIYILDPAVFDFFRAGEVTDWSGDVFPKLLKEGERVYGWAAAGYWEDVGSHAAYMKANFDCMEGRVKVQIPGQRVGEGIWIHEDAEVSPSARVDGPAVICAGSTVNANVRIWPNKEVEPGAVVRESIIWAGSWKRGLFSSYGLTGLTNVEFTPEFAARLGAAVGALNPVGAEIAISRDYTRSARMIGRAIISGMISSGANVTDLSVMPAPVARFWAKHNRIAAMHVQTSPVDPRS